MKETRMVKAHDPETVAMRPFEWTGRDGQHIKLMIPERIKRGRVSRLLGRGDLIGALDAIFTPEEMAAFDDLELSVSEWEDLKNAVFDAIAGVDPKN